MVHAYLGERGVHEDTRICVIAGFVGSVREWERFEGFWDAETRGPGFHAEDFFTRDPSGGCLSSTYRAWNARTAEAFLDTLLWAMGNVRIIAVGAAVDVVAFRGYSDDERRALTNAITVAGKWRLSGASSDPYKVPFHWSILKGASLVHRDDWKIHFAFDRQDRFAGDAREMYRQITGDPANGDLMSRLGDVWFPSRVDAPPLQAADLAAHCWYHLLVHGRAGITKSMARAADTFTGKGDQLRVFNQDAMDKLLAKIAPGPGNLRRVL